jgi:rhodanese-related sulfurtransferase
MIEAITPQRAAELVEKGARLIDIREPNEHRRERLPGAKCVPLSTPSNTIEQPLRFKGPVIFHCRSGMRTTGAAQQLAAATEGTSFILEGGLEGWKAAGLPTILDRRQPIEIMRQVQIVAGSLVAAGVLLGFFVHPSFNLLAGAVGAGLFFSGVSGFCGMARILNIMPWNKRAAPQNAS